MSSMSLRVQAPGPVTGAKRLVAQPPRGQQAEQAEGGQVGQAIPVDGERPELQGDGIDLGVHAACGLLCPRHVTVPVPATNRMKRASAGLSPSTGQTRLVSQPGSTAPAPPGRELGRGAIDHARAAGTACTLPAPRPRRARPRPGSRWSASGSPPARPAAAPAGRVVQAEIASCSEGTMRRGKITSGSASTSRQRAACRRARQRMLRRQRQHQRLARDAQALQARRREAGRMQHEAGVDLAAREALRSCTSPVASTSSSATCGYSARKSRTHGGSRPKPTVETNASRSRARLRRPPRRARAPAAPGRAPAARAPPAAAPRRPGVSCDAALGAVEQPHAEQLLELRDGLRQRRLRHVQRARRRGRSAAPRPRPRTGASSAQFDRGRHSYAEHINRRLKFGLERISGAAILCAPRATTDEQPWTPRPSRSTAAAPTSPRAVARARTARCTTRMGYEEGDFEQADGRRRQRPLHHHAVQRRPAAAGRRAPSPASRKPAATPQMFGTPTISDGMAMGTEGMKYSLVVARSDLRLHRDLRAAASGWTACWWSAAATRTCPAA